MLVRHDVSLDNAFIVSTISFKNSEQVLQASGNGLRTKTKNLHVLDSGYRVSKIQVFNIFIVSRLQFTTTGGASLSRFHVLTAPEGVQ